MELESRTRLFRTGSTSLQVENWFTNDVLEVRIKTTLSQAKTTTNTTKGGQQNSMSLLSELANFTDGFTNTSSTFAPSVEGSDYYDNITWHPFSTITPAPVENSGQSSSGCLDNCNENNVFGTTLFFLLGVLLFLGCVSLHARKQDS